MKRFICFALLFLCSGVFALETKSRNAGTLDGIDSTGFVQTPDKPLYDRLRVVSSSHLANPMPDFVGVRSSFTVIVSTRINPKEGVAGNVFTKFGSSDSWAAAATASASTSKWSRQLSANSASSPSTNFAPTEKIEFSNQVDLNQSSFSYVVADYEDGYDGVLSWTFEVDDSFGNGNVNAKIVYLSTGVTTGTSRWQIRTRSVALGENWHTVVMSTTTFTPQDVQGTALLISTHGATMTSPFAAGDVVYLDLMRLTGSDSFAGTLNFLYLYLKEN